MTVQDFSSIKHHLIGVEFARTDGIGTGLLLRADKNNYKDILRALLRVSKAAGTGSSTQVGLQRGNEARP